MQEITTLYENINWQNVIDRIAEGLGTTSEYLWDILVQGTIVNGIVTLVVLGLMWVIGIMFGIFGCRNLRKMPWSEHWGEEIWCRLWFMGIIPIAICLILTAVFLSNTKDCGMNIGAPEYQALRFLITEARS